MSDHLEFDHSSEKPSGPGAGKHPLRQLILSTTIVVVLFDESEQRLPEWEVQRARALALCEQSLEDRDQRLFDQAVAALDAVLARDPNDVNVLRSLGGLCSYAGKDAQAAMLFEAALQADPPDELSLLNLGLMASRIGSFRKGLRSYEAYLKLNPWDATVFAPYVVMLAKSGDLPAAVETAERGLRLDPTDRELRRIAVQLYASIGDQQTSVQHQEKLREISNQLDPWDEKHQDRLRKQMQQRPQQLVVTTTIARYFWSSDLPRTVDESVHQDVIKVLSWPELDLALTTSLFSETELLVQLDRGPVGLNHGETEFLNGWMCFAPFDQRFHQSTADSDGLIFFSHGEAEGASVGKSAALTAGKVQHPDDGSIDLSHEEQTCWRLSVLSDPILPLFFGQCEFIRL